MVKMIFECTDGYHDSSYFFEDGTNIEGEKNFIEFLCKPHEDFYIFRTIHYDDLEQGEDEIIYQSFDQMNKYERRNNFDNLIYLYNKYYIMEEEIIVEDIL